MYRMILRLALILAIPTLAAAQTATFEFTADYPTMADHWPNLDAWVGTADDLISGSPSPSQESAPNPGTYSYNAFDFGGGLTDPGMPTGFIAMTFVSGTAQVDMAVARGLSPTSPLITGLSVTSGTEPFPGHGPFTAEFTNISGDYDAASGAFNLTTDFTANLNGNVDSAWEPMNLAGEAWVIEEADYGTVTGHAYLDDVVIPLAQAEGAARVLYMRGSGTIPHAQNFNWGDMPMIACVVALDDDGVQTEPAAWGDVKALYGSR